MQNRTNKGITLIETLIYVAIIALIAGTFVNYALSISDNREKTYVISETQYNLRNAVDVISREIRKADGINISDSVFDSDPGILSLSRNQTSLNPTIISLDQDDGILQIKEGNNATTTITSNEVKVTNLVFSDLTNSGDREVIKFNIFVEFNNLSGTNIYDYSQTATTTVNIRQ